MSTSESKMAGAPDHNIARALQVVADARAQATDPEEKALLAAAADLLAATEEPFEPANVFAAELRRALRD